MFILKYTHQGRRGGRCTPRCRSICSIRFGQGSSIGGWLRPEHQPHTLFLERAGHTGFPDTCGPLRHCTPSNAPVRWGEWKRLFCFVQMKQRKIEMSHTVHGVQHIAIFIFYTLQTIFYIFHLVCLFKSCCIVYTDVNTGIYLDFFFICNPWHVMCSITLMVQCYKLVYHHRLQLILITMQCNVLPRSWCLLALNAPDISIHQTARHFHPLYKPSPRWCWILYYF